MIKKYIMKVHLQHLASAACLSLLLFLFSCTHGVRLSAQEVKAGEASGTYTAVLYGCNYTDDPESVAFLDREGDPYVMEPLTALYNYKTIQGMGANEAFAAAEKFLGCSTALAGYRVREIAGPDGKAIGYEIRPLYYPFVYGAGEVLAINYWLQGDKVMIYVRLHPWAEHLFFGGSSVTDNN